MTIHADLSLSDYGCPAKEFSLRGDEPKAGGAPADIVLLLDRSLSLRGVPFEKLKISAKNFINIICKKTSPPRSCQIGGGCRIGIVSFCDRATKDQPLTQSVGMLKTSIDCLKLGPGSNHYDGFLKARELFDISPNQKIIVLFTDGYPTAGNDPQGVTAEMRGSGIRIYGIGLEGTRGISEVITNWANPPSFDYTDSTDDLEQVDTLFQKIAHSLPMAGPANGPYR